MKTKSFMTGSSHASLFIRISAVLLVVVSIFTTSNLYANKKKNERLLEKSIQQLPASIQTKILSQRKQFLKLVKKLSQLPNVEALTILVDKQHELPADYAPKSILDLSQTDWGMATRANIFISSQIASDLKKMLEAASREGINLQIASGYRDYAYQKNLFDYWTKQLGAAKAQRLSAAPGTSQHQLGTVVDFYPVNVAFDGTEGQKWLQAHASRYGFSLSYPWGHEKDTGYMYESWHYRYISPLGCQIQDEFFQGMQYLFLSWYRVYEEGL